MDLTQKQTYLCYMQFLGDKLLEWREKSKNEDLKNAVKSYMEIHHYVSMLENELAIVKLREELHKKRIDELEKDFWSVKINEE